MIEIEDWRGLYRESWGKEIVPKSYSHPAKFRPALIRRVYAYLLEQGYLQPGQMVLDPFAGVALGALHAMQRGLIWIGVELESRFVDLGQQNIDLWNKRYGTLPGWGQAAVVQGDSRHLCEVLAGAGFTGAVSSPPYSNKVVRERSSHLESARLKAKGLTDTPHGLTRGQLAHEAYGQAIGQLASLPEDDAPQVPQAGAVVSSMPFTTSDNRGAAKMPDGYFVRQDGTPFGEGRSIYGTLDSPANFGNLPAGEPPIREYGVTAGQLGAMTEGQPVQVQASVSSPPFEHTTGHDGGKKHLPRIGNFALDYGATNGQLGTESGTIFWEAATEIMRQVQSALPCGAVAAWVCKAFVRGGELVDFPDQWRVLGESCGFETIARIRCWLVEGKGAQWTLENELEERYTERKSFFRLLSERRARAQKHWQSVPRMDQARYLWDAHHDLWEDYKLRWFVVLLSILLGKPDQEETDTEALAEQLGVLPDEICDKPTRPTRGSIARVAQMAAYTEAGMPRIEIETAIDYEVVLIQRKLPPEVA